MMTSSRIANEVYFIIFLKQITESGNLDDRQQKLYNLKKRENKRLKKREQSLKDQWNNTEMGNVCAIRDADGDKVEVNSLV